MLSGGADQLYALEGVDAHVAREFLDRWEAPWIDVASLSEEARELAERLVAAGVAVPDRLQLGRQRVELGYLGTRDEALDSELRAHLASELVGAGHGDLVVFVRTNAELKEACLGSYAELERPHLLVDAAYHHTVSLGPLVFPGETACFGCLVGRIARHWGDDEPPPRPEIQRRPALIASLTALEVEKFAAGDYSLVNRTVAWDIARHVVHDNAVYKLPWCPVCEVRSPGEPLGSIALPWAETA